MPAMTIILDGEGAWPDLMDKPVIHLRDDATIAVAALPGGMRSGKPSIAFRFDLPDGQIVIAETSWALFGMCARAVAARYGWPE